MHRKERNFSSLNKFSICVNTLMIAGGNFKEEMINTYIIHVGGLSDYELKNKTNK